MKVGDIKNLLAYSIFLQIATIVSCENFEETRAYDPDRSDAVGNATSTVELKVFLIMTTRETSSKIVLPASHDHKFDLKKPSVFIIHGYLSNSQADWAKRLAKVYLEQKDVAVFIVDWSSVAMAQTYSEVVSRIGDVALELMNFIKLLNVDEKVDGSRVHVIGHSLGAHISGIVGKMIPNVNRITGLDPAGPGFETPSPWGLLSTDAKYVDVIHTNDGISGIKNPRGNVDFYVNGGANQPGCGSPICSHIRATTYFIESIENPKCLFVAAKTESEADKVWSENFDEWVHTIMGLDTFIFQARGTMFIVTNQDSPFCRGSAPSPPENNIVAILKYLIDKLVDLGKWIFGL